MSDLLLKRSLIRTVNFIVTTSYKPLFALLGSSAHFASPKPQAKAMVSCLISKGNLCLTAKVCTRRGVLRSNRGGVHPYTRTSMKPVRVENLLGQSFHSLI